MDPQFWERAAWQFVVVGILLLVLIAAVCLVYRMHRRHTLREMAAITMQERHLYRALQDQMEDVERLRMAQHDAKNELLVLQSFLERGETQAARDYLDGLLAREDPAAAEYQFCAK